MNNIKARCKKFAPVGSRITCNPAPTDTDEDFLLLVDPNEFDEIENIVMDDGFVMGGSRIHAGGCNEGDDESFQSYTKGDKNLIITASDVFYTRFMAATSVAKRLNLLDKADRITLFQAVLYGNEAS